MTPIEAGTVLAGKYRLEALIGQGGMGSVWRAQHLDLRAHVAVKLLNIDILGGSAEMLARFRREAQAAAAIRSPHVVQIFDHGVDDASGTPFIVMELMDGQSLADRLSRSGPISPSDVARIFTQVARALSRAHDAGIVHRDLKPDNVFLVRNEEDEIAKVLDFGIAKAPAHALDTDSETRTGAVLGTAYYMSPEQIRGGSKDVDLRADLWAFGVMACECITGRRPFVADTFGELTLKICVDPLPRPSTFAPVPDGFDAWFERSVSRDPLQRFASAREAADTLRQVCTGEVTASAPPPAPPPTPALTDGVVRAASATTGVPLSRPAPDLAVPAPKSKRVMSLALVVVAVATTGGSLWLRHATLNQPETEPSSNAPTAALSPALPEAPLASAIAAAAASVTPTPPIESSPPPVRPAPTPPKPSPVPAARPSAVAQKPRVRPAQSSVPVRDVIDDRR